MEIPRSERTGSGEIFEDAMGRCAKCGMLKMSIAGVKQCPNCDTKSQTRSGKVNNIKSVPQSAFKKVKKKGLDGKPYYEMVAKSKKEMQMQLKLQDKGKLPIKEESNVVVSDFGKIEKRVLTQVSGHPEPGPLPLLSLISDYFEKAPAKNMVEFKKVDKLRKAIKKLRGQVEEFLGGNIK